MIVSEPSCLWPLVLISPEACVGPRSPGMDVVSVFSQPLQALPRGNFRLCFFSSYQPRNAHSGASGVFMEPQSGEGIRDQAWARPCRKWSIPNINRDKCISREPFGKQTGRGDRNPSVAGYVPPELSAIGETAGLLRNPVRRRGTQEELEEVIFKLKTSYRKVTQREKHSWENEMLL